MNNEPGGQMIARYFDGELSLQELSQWATAELAAWSGGGSGLLSAIIAELIVRIGADYGQQFINPLTDEIERVAGENPHLVSLVSLSLDLAQAYGSFFLTDRQA